MSDLFLTDKEHFRIFAVLRKHRRLERRDRGGGLDYFVGVTSGELNDILRHMRPLKRQYAPNRTPPLVAFRTLGMVYRPRISFFGHLIDTSREDTRFRIAGLFIHVRSRRNTDAGSMTTELFQHIRAPFKEHAPDEADLWEYPPAKTGFLKRRPCYRAWWD